MRQALTGLMVVFVLATHGTAQILGTDAVARAIAEGQQAKGRFDPGANGVATDAWGSGFRVHVTGPLNDIAQASHDATRKYQPFTPDNVTADLVEPVIRVFALPVHPSVPAAEHVVLRVKASGAVVQPLRVTTVPETWQNLYGAQFKGQGIVAVFTAADLPTEDFDVVIVLSGTSDRAWTVKKKDREKIR